MKFFLIILSMFALCLTACTKSTDQTGTTDPVVVSPIQAVGCSVEQSLSKSIADGLESAIGCSGKDAIQADILAAAGKANLCTAVASSDKTLKVSKSGADRKGVIGNVACPLLVNALGVGAMKSLPAKWECKGGDNVTNAQNQIIALCEKNISF